MKSLECRNEDLQDRIHELEEEARQREHQQAKHIQEITDAYEAVRVRGLCQALFPVCGETDADYQISA